jgi:hypothetical protein
MTVLGPRRGVWRRLLRETRGWNRQMRQHDKHKKTQGHHLFLRI